MLGVRYESQTNVRDTSVIKFFFLHFSPFFSRARVGDAIKNINKKIIQYEYNDTITADIEWGNRGLGAPA